MVYLEYTLLREESKSRISELKQVQSNLRTKDTLDKSRCWSPPIIYLRLGAIKMIYMYMYAWISSPNPYIIIKTLFEDYTIEPPR